MGDRTEAVRHVRKKKKGKGLCSLVLVPHRLMRYKLYGTIILYRIFQEICLVIRVDRKACIAETSRGAELAMCCMVGQIGLIVVFERACSFTN